MVLVIMLKQLKNTFHDLTDPKRTFRSFSCLEKILFLTLCFFEFFYRIIFFIINTYKKSRAKKTQFTVISVGNLSVGGTGKSVIVPFLVKMFGENESAIFLRGYGSQIAKIDESIVLNLSNEPAETLSKKFGDEAVMYKQKINCPVVVGKNRFLSSQALEKFCRKKNKDVKYVFLDDAYQNHQLKKHCEILLLDARRPFENGHCLPAGKLRERDFTSADIVIVTHADEVNQSACDAIKKKLSLSISVETIFFGKHVFDGLYYYNKKKTDQKLIFNKRFLLATGVGSPEGVRATVGQFGVCIVGHEQFEDHHNFTLSDIEHLCMRAQTLSCSGILVTEKDWVKLFPLLGEYRYSFYVIRVRFEFLSPGEYDAFMRVCNIYIK